MDTSAVIKFFPDRNEFTYRIIPDTIIKWDTIWIDADPIIIRGEEDWEKGGVDCRNAADKPGCLFYSETKTKKVYLRK